MQETHTYDRRWWTLGVLCFSLLVIGMDNTILNVALPTIQRELGASSSQLQWIVDAYTIVYASILLTTGSLGDRFGRKRALTAGLLIFGAGSVAAAFATTSGTLITFRAIAGIGGALIMPATLSILTNVFPPEERGRAIGIWAGVSGLGIVIGPLTGGWLLEHFSWGSVFFINVPVVLIALAGGHFFVPDSRDPSAPRLDMIGTVLASTGLAALLYGIIEAPARGWGDSAVLGAFTIGLVVLAAFVAWELHSDHPMLEIRFFTNPRFSGASFAITLVFFAMFGSMYFMSQFLQFVLGYSAMRAGAAMIPVAAAMMLLAPNSAKISARFGTKYTVAGGLAIVAVALGMLSLVSVDTSYPYVGLVMFIMGAGMASAMAPATESIMNSVPKEKAGIGSAMNDTTRQVGGALGVAILGSLTAASYHSAIDKSAALNALPDPARAAAHDSLGGALAVAQRIGGGAQQLVTDASHAFVNGMTSTVLIAAGVALLGALVALFFLPNKETAPAIETEPTFVPEPERELVLAAASAD